MRIEFRLLGPLEARCDGAVLPVSSGRQRTVLAALLLRANHVVAVDELAEVLWGSQLPPSARVTVQNYVKRLRDALGDVGRLVVTQSPGYLIRVAPDQLDVSVFEAHLDAARTATAAGTWDSAAAAARTALLLWRGEPLADVPSDYLASREVRRLAELRLQATEIGFDAALQLGAHADVVGELRRLVASDPLRERFAALLMIALHGGGRQAEALAVYQQTRDVLIAELGVEPGDELRALHQRILSGGQPPPREPSPAAIDTTLGRGSATGPEVPRQLPAAVGCFTGRTRELAALTGLLGNSPDAATQTMVISAIGGTAGVGKTALAIECAHRVAGKFPDGQLYVNLRGYDPDRRLAPAEALAGFLAALGVPGQQIPLEQEERAARYRTLLAGRRVLVVLDNAGDVAQVRPLLPGSPGCAVLVTSRDALAGLLARDGAIRLDLDLMPFDDAISLLRVLIGARVDAEPGAAAQLVIQCARLPLALRVAAELAATQPAVPLAALAGQLTDQRRRLDLLDAGGDPRTAVRAVFSWSYRELDCDAARAFRLVGAHPGADFDAYAAAALIDASLLKARQLLDQLARAHLIRPAGQGRHGMHDLLRGYALELAVAADGGEERRTALTRLFDYYLHAAGAAMDTLFPAERHRRPSAPPAGTPAPALTEPAAAQDWLDGELTSLVSVATYTADHGWPSHATRLGRTLFRYLDSCGHYPEAIVVHSHAVSAARHTADRAAEAEALTSLGVGHVRQGRHESAAAYLEPALTLYRENGDRPGEARALHNLGSLRLFQGSFQQATGHFTQALNLYHELGDSANEGHALATIGDIDLRQGRYQEAADRLRQALALCRTTGDRPGEAHALVNLGLVATRMGLYRQAAGRFRQAVTLSCQTGNRAAEAYALASRGDLEVQTGHHARAGATLERALFLFRDIGDLSGEAQAHNSLGELNAAMSRPSDAHTQHAAALALASQVGDKCEQARAHHGLASAYQTDRDSGQARLHWQQALTLYTELGAPEADQARAQLAETDTLLPRAADH